MIKNFKGLTQAEVIASREKNGSNALEREKSKGIFIKFLENLSDPIIRVLMIAVVLEIIFTLGRCNWLEVGGIIAAVIIATAVSTVSEYGSERAFMKMREESENARARVIRSGEITEIPIADIVVGDLLCISAGETVAADGVIVYGKATVDQSALNGESREVRKQPSNSTHRGLDSENSIFRGSLVSGGEAVIRVEGVGKETYYGMVARDIQAQTRESPLKRRLSELAKAISKLGYLMAAIVGLSYLFFTVIHGNGYDPALIGAMLKDGREMVGILTHALTLMITVVVVAVPEGLPMMITVVLSANMKRMLNDSVMVKKLVGIETAGSMNILFTDKTGTLTVGRPSVERVITVSGIYKNASALRCESECSRWLNISAKEGTSGVSGTGGNSTDRAFSEFFREEKGGEASVKSRVDFSSERKFSSVELITGESVIKGAPDILLKYCSYALDKNDRKIVFDGERIMREYRSAAMTGERVIAVIMRDTDNNYVFIALVVMKDKLRRDALRSVDRLRAAGIQTVMITGDGRETAAAIAAECGIIKGGYGRIITHEQLDSMSDSEIRAILPELRVVARALPSDKSRLVKIAQEADLVVGMTGDGINDAPALKLADVGFAMGSGTDIAKGAGDIIILNNSLSAICSTVLYGRTIFKSIRKFISFQLMMNLVACGVSLIGQFIGVENPITIIQMLWINIIMDTLGGLAFAGEAPLEYYMMEPPKARNEKILSRDMLNQILITGGYTLIMCIAFLRLDFFSSLFRASPQNTCFLTGFYCLFIFSGIFNCFNARSERMSLLSNICKNRGFLAIMLLIAVIQIAMIYFGGEIFRSVPLSFRELLNVILMALSVIPFDMVRRIVKKLS